MAETHPSAVVLSYVGFLRKLKVWVFLLETGVTCEVVFVSTRMRVYVSTIITYYAALVYAFLSISTLVEGAYSRVFALHVTIEILSSPHALQMIFASSFTAYPLPNLAIISRALVSTIYRQK